MNNVDYSKLKYVVYDYSDQRFYRLRFVIADSSKVYLEFQIDSERTLYRNRVVLNVHLNKTLFSHIGVGLGFLGFKTYAELKKGIVEAIKKEALPERFRNKFKQKYPEEFL